MRKLRVLSIDGGGLRGVIPLGVIEYIEAYAGKPVHEIFDVVAGTSTGGLLACALTVPGANGNRKYSIAEIRNIYEGEGENIFPKFGYWNENISPVFSPKYDPRGLEVVLKEYFNEVKLIDSLTPLFITSYNLYRDQPVFFTSREARIDPDKNISLAEVCRATSAAPTYFPSHDLDFGRERVHCVDGGVFMNNPSLGVLTEVLANSLSPEYDIAFGNGLTDIHLLSLGTGYSNENVINEEAKKWGLFKWAKPIVDLAMRGPVNEVNRHLDVIFQMFKAGNNYHRVDIPLDKNRMDMSDSSSTTMAYWNKAVKDEVWNNQTRCLDIDVFLSESGIKDVR